MGTRVWTQAALLGLMALGGCSSGGGGGSNDPGLLLGSWRRLDPVSRQVESQLTFDKDGRVQVQAGVGSTAAAGLYEADDDSLVIESTDARDGLRYRDSWPYRVSQDRLIVRVLEPSGGHDGIKGTWRGSFHTDRLETTGWRRMATVTWVITFRADNTVRLEESSENGPIQVEGTYQTVGGNAYQATFSQGVEPFSVIFSLADDVIGDLYVR